MLIEILRQDSGRFCFNPLVVIGALEVFACNILDCNWESVSRKTNFLQVILNTIGFISEYCFPKNVGAKKGKSYGTVIQFIPLLLDGRDFSSSFISKDAFQFPLLRIKIIA